MQKRCFEDTAYTGIPCQALCNQNTPSEHGSIQCNTILALTWKKAKSKRTATASKGFDGTRNPAYTQRWSLVNAGLAMRYTLDVAVGVSSLL